MNEERDLEEGNDQAHRGEREKCCPMTDLETLGLGVSEQQELAFFPRDLARKHSGCVICLTQNLPYCPGRQAHQHLPVWPEDHQAILESSAMSKKPPNISPGLRRIPFGIP